MVEQSIRNRQVGGSSPPLGSIFFFPKFNEIQPLTRFCSVTDVRLHTPAGGQSGSCWAKFSHSLATPSHETDTIPPHFWFAGRAASSDRGHGSGAAHTGSIESWFLKIGRSLKFDRAYAYDVGCNFKDALTSAGSYLNR